MHHRFIQLAMLSLFCLALTGLGTATPIHADSGEYTVIETTELDLQVGRFSKHAHLSPNGALFAYSDMKQMCIYTTAGVQQVCTPLVTGKSRMRLDPESVVWSPDSSKIAFMSQFLLTLKDPGVWMMDVVSGELTKLTGVGYERADVLSDDIIIDVAPQWMPDSQHLVFLRYEQINKVLNGPFVSVLDIVTGEIAQYDNLISQTISIYVTDVSADGKWLAYNNEERGTKIEGGLWLYNLDTKDFKKLTSVTDYKLMPRVISINAEATHVLVTDASDTSETDDITTSEGFDPAKCPVHIVEATTGKQMLVDEQRCVRRAGWSPDGKHIAYIVQDPMREEINGLYITSEVGKAGKRVLAGAFFVPTNKEGQPILWADDNTLLVSDREREYMLTVVRLGMQ